MDDKLAIASWSGGKDSCFAYYQALQAGYEVKYLLNFISRESRRGCFHGIESGVLELQAGLIGVPIVQKETTADMQKYEEEFKEAVREIKSDKRIGTMVFGDIYLDEHKQWVERVCKDVDIKPLEPLWNRPALEIMKDFVKAGFKAMVVSAQADKFNSDFVGRVIDHKLIDELSARKICPCGENGEFHTLVIDGPVFKRAIKIEESVPILKEGFWKHWFLDIKSYN